MAQICEDIMAKCPSALTICDHGKEKQECPKCRVPSIAESVFLKVNLPKEATVDILEAALAARSPK